MDSMEARKWAVEQAMSWCWRPGNEEFYSDAAMEALAERLLTFAETGKFPEAQ